MTQPAPASFGDVQAAFAAGFRLVQLPDNALHSPELNIDFGTVAMYSDSFEIGPHSSDIVSKAASQLGWQAAETIARLAAKMGTKPLRFRSTETANWHDLPMPQDVGDDHAPGRGGNTASVCGVSLKMTRRRLSFFIIAENPDQRASGTAP
jgi:hypothetical protein